MRSWPERHDKQSSLQRTNQSSTPLRTTLGHVQSSRFRATGGTRPFSFQEPHRVSTGHCAVSHELLSGARPKGTVAPRAFLRGPRACVSQRLAGGPSCDADRAGHRERRPSEAGGALNMGLETPTGPVWLTPVCAAALGLGNGTLQQTQAQPSPPTESSPPMAWVPRCRKGCCSPPWGGGGPSCHRGGPMGACGGEGGVLVLRPSTRHEEKGRKGREGPVPVLRGRGRRAGRGGPVGGALVSPRVTRSHPEASRSAPTGQRLARAVSPPSPRG